MTLIQALEKAVPYLDQPCYIERESWDTQIMGICDWGYNFWKCNPNEAWYNRWGITSYALTLEDLQADDWKMSLVVHSEVMVDL